MPTSKIKSKTGAEYQVSFKVTGDLGALTTEQLQALALRYIRNAARAQVVAGLNEAEPAVVNNQRMAAAMLTKLKSSPEEVKEFFAETGMPLEVPTSFEIPLVSLIPGDSGRGKKASDIFSFESADTDNDDEAEDATV